MVKPDIYNMNIEQCAHCPNKNQGNEIALFLSVPKFRNFREQKNQRNFPKKIRKKNPKFYFLPCLVFGGDVHFDEEEDWTVDTPKGTR